MKEHYVSYSQAVKLKELEFDWPCTAHFSSDGSQLWTKHQEVINSEEFKSPAAPRLDQAQAWLREQYGIHVSANPYSDCSTDADDKVCDEWYFWSFKLTRVPSGVFIDDADGEYESYELALSAGIDAALEALELLTNKQTDK